MIDAPEKTWLQIYGTPCICNNFATLCMSKFLCVNSEFLAKNGYVKFEVEIPSFYSTFWAYNEILRFELKWDCYVYSLNVDLKIEILKLKEQFEFIKLTSSNQVPCGYSPQVCVVMKGHFENPSLESSSFCLRLSIIDLKIVIILLFQSQ